MFEGAGKIEPVLGQKMSKSGSKEKLKSASKQVSRSPEFPEQNTVYGSFQRPRTALRFRSNQSITVAQNKSSDVLYGYRNLKSHIREQNKFQSSWQNMEQIKKLDHNLKKEKVGQHSARTIQKGLQDFSQPYAPLGGQNQDLSHYRNLTNNTTASLNSLNILAMSKYHNAKVKPRLQKETKVMKSYSSFNSYNSLVQNLFDVPLFQVNNSRQRF